MKESMRQQVINWCKTKASEGTILFDNNESNTWYVRFKTPKMENLLPPILPKQGEWVKYRYYMYEIEVRDNFISMGLTVTSLPYRDGKPHPLCNVLRKTYGRCQKEAWTTAKLFRDSFHYCATTSPAEIINYLDNQLQSLLQKESGFIF